jgi:filamentous hemagglutinin family protein
MLIAAPPRTERNGAARLLRFLTSVSVVALVAAAPLQAGAAPRGYWSAPAGGAAAAAAAAAAATAASQQAAALAAQSQQSMATTMNAIRGLWNAQAAARATALSLPGNVFNGLGKGGAGQLPGLVVDPRVKVDPSLWINASQPVQTVSSGQTNVTINQTAPRAVLTWEYFNIGRTTTLTFDQHGNASWVALNRIDATGVPSQILGRIKADGTVLLINPNGIIFGGSSQINVGALIASSLDIDSSAAASVFKNAPNYKPITLDGLKVEVPPNEDSANSFFAGSGLYSIAATTAIGQSVVFSLGDQSLGSSGHGAISVEPGALINAKATALDSGYVALFGTSVTNGGGITSQNGQIILTAASSIQLAEPLSSATGVNTARTVTVLNNLGQVAGRGAPTFTPLLLDGKGVVTNDAGGLLVSNDGAVTLTGDKIYQLGAIEATTSVNRAGSVTLDTTQDTTSTSGNIVLGPGSITTILPDESSGTIPAVNATPAYFAANNLQPQINIEAMSGIDMQDGALIKAPGAALTMVAGSNTPGTGTVLLEKGSTIDLSGLAGVAAPKADYSISILVTAAEVADDPLAKFLIGKTVTVDARLSGTRADGFQWVGSPLLDAAGYTGTIPKTIDEILATGGSFTVQGSGSGSGVANFIQQSGAVINVSGGSIDYAGGVVKTTQLLGADGRIYDIGSASPAISYVGIAGQYSADRASWGAPDIYTSMLFDQGYAQPGYVSGTNAGAINISAKAPILEGSVIAATVSGRRQLDGTDGRPLGAALSISFDNTTHNPYNVILEPLAAAGADPYGLNSFSFGSPGWSPALAGNVFPLFTDSLSSSNFGSISITGSHQLSMASNATLSVQPGGSVTLGNVTTIDGTINAPGGSITIEGYSYPKDGTGTPLTSGPPVPALVIGPDAVLNVRGLWVNDTRAYGDAMEGSAFIDSGSVSIVTYAASKQDPKDASIFTDVTQSIELAPGSVIDVSSGGYVGSSGTLEYGPDGLPLGKGGSVALVTYAPIPGSGARWVPYDPASLTPPTNVRPTAPNEPNRANVILGGTIYAEGFDGGGTFALQAPTITIDGNAAKVTSFTSGTRQGEIVLPPSFFAGNGFGTYALTSTYTGVTVTADTKLELRQSNYLPNGTSGQILTGLPLLGTGPNGGAIAAGQLPDYLQPTGAIVRDFEPIGLEPEWLRKPANLILTQSAYQFADGGDPAAKAGILVDSKARITADPGATISLTSDGPVTILGSLIAPGGTISLVNTDLSITTGAQGPQDVWIGATAVLDVSGVFVPNPLAAAYVTGEVLGAGTIALNGGTVVVQPGAQLQLKGASATIEAINETAGGGRRFVELPAWSNGGALQLAGNNIYFAGTVDAAGGAPLAAGGSLTVSGGSSLVIEPAGLVAANLPKADGLAYPVTPGELAAMTPADTGGYIGADTLNKSGFDSVALSAQTVAFAGTLSVSVPGSLTISATNGNIELLPASAKLLPAGITDPTKFALPSCPSAGSCVPSIGGTKVNLDAGYVLLAGVSGTNLTTAVTPPNVADGTLNISAQWIDLQGVIGLDNVGDANFTSAGAVRLLPNFYGYPIADVSSSSPLFGAGALIAPGDLTLSAAEIFPVSETQYLLMSTGTIAGVDDKLTIKQNGTATAPLSVGGTIALDAQTIVQEGTLWAPLGNIVVGVTDPHKQIQQLASLLAASYCIDGAVCGAPNPAAVTKNVTLAAGSLTSVSAAGLDLPYGYTIDGTTWYLGANSSNPGQLGQVVTSLPAKSVGLFGANISTASGAVIDVSGGGDVYATEFVAGTGGTRNVLTTYDLNLALSTATTAIYSSQYADGRQVYALVPAYEAKIAAYDPTFANYPYYSGIAVQPGTSLSNISPASLFANAIAPGSAITITGGNGIAAGTYVLLPGMYATLPGSYRVVEVASNVNPVQPFQSFSIPSGDGSLYVMGSLTNVLTGSRSSQTDIFQIQPRAVWTHYSDIKVTSGTSFFRNLAIEAHAALPPLPIDGGALTLGATGTLSLDSTYRFAPGTSDLAPGVTGAGGEVQISAANILILASDQKEPAEDAAEHYLVLDAAQISSLGATSVLIGGTATPSSGGVTITADALNLEVKTDAAHPLTGPELILVTKGGDGKGLVVDAGSVIEAQGTVPAGSERNITIGALRTGSSPGISGDAALLLVSNGAPVSITQLNVPADPLARFSIGSGVIIDGGNALTLASSGAGSLAGDAKLVAQNYDFASNVINIGGGSSGLVLTAAMISDLAGANSVELQSASVINFYDAHGLTVGNTANPIGTLIFDAAGLFGEGGATTINARNVVLTDSQQAPNVTGALTGSSGTLSVNASGTVTQDAGSLTLGSFGQVNLTASQAIVFNGTGTLDARTANVTLTAPELVVNAAASQTLTTKGTLDIAHGAGTALANPATNIGGALTLTAAEINDSGVIKALSGKVTLKAVSGNLTLGAGARIDATGSVVPVLDQKEYAPGGAVKLVADAGNVTLDPGSVVDVSAAGNGYAGSLAITTAPSGTAALGGTLLGRAAFNDTGGDFILDAGSLSGALPLTGGFTDAFAVTLQHGDIAITAGSTLTSRQVALTAANGSILVDGTIDASGPSAGQIALYGADGVTIDAGAQLLARYEGAAAGDPGYANGTSAMVQKGGTIILGVAGKQSGTVNSKYGYEDFASSGAITVAAGARFDVSGGTGGDGIDNSGGEVILRAPILTDGHVNVGFHGTLITNASSTGQPSGQGVVLDAYAVWSTKDASKGGQHFDGIIDPAGWYSSGGTLVAGVFKDANGNVVAQWDGTKFTSGGSHSLSYYLTNDYFSPTTANAEHVAFYQKTLVSFVEGFHATADFSGAQISVNGGALLALPASLEHSRPEIELVNPSAATNGGNITVATNWNLGAGVFDSHGNYVPYYRTSAGEAGVLTLRAKNNVAVNATISDGFYERTDAFGGSVLVANLIANNPQQSGRVFDYNTTSAASLMPIVSGINNGSFSFDFVAGASFTEAGADPANPDTVIPVTASIDALHPAGSVTIDGHTSYTNALPGAFTNTAINIPTLLRTGTGSITLTAAGNVELLDKDAPGAVYTAGAAVPAPAGFTPLTVPYTSTPNGLVSTPAWAEGGGAVTVIAGQSIIGIEMPADADGSQTGIFNGLTGQFWSDWYAHAGLSNGSETPFAPSAAGPGAQTAAWVNYATFFQGFGALGGGNITLTAGRDITDVSASLPETLAVSGGLTASNPPVAHYYGGGNLRVTAGGNLESGVFLVGRGSGLIQAGGAVQADTRNPITGQPAAYTFNDGSGTVSQPQPLLLAVQDGFIRLNAQGAITLGGIYDPASLVSDQAVQTNVYYLPGGDGGRFGGSNPFWGNLFTSFGPGSGIALTSVTGDITAPALGANSSDLNLFLHNGSVILGGSNVSSTTIGSLLPATLDLIALTGNINATAGGVGGGNLLPYPTQTGSDKGTITFAAAGSISVAGSLAMRDLLTSSSQYLGDANIIPVSYSDYISPLGIPLPNLTQALHANDPVPVIIAAGQDIDLSAATLQLIKPAMIEAGHDLIGPSGATTTSFAFIGQNNNASDITSITAGHDITGGEFILYGPGTLLLQAGHNIGPFLQSIAGTSTASGVMAVGDGSNYTGTLPIPGSPSFPPLSYLPHQSASIDVLFGTGPGIDYQSATRQFVDPAHAGTGGIDFLPDIAAMLGETLDKAWTDFQALPAAQRHLLIDRAFLDFLTAVVTGYSNSSSPYFGKYDAAYEAIRTLFPASYGYTSSTGSGAAAQATTGQLNIAQSVLETQMGGDINIIGPGGNIVVGSTSRDTLSPVQEGILTLAGGTIRAFASGSILLNQSRILTLEGGNVDLFSSNGDISAGAGPKTYVSDPPISEICDFNGYCPVNPSGLVSGAGIGALLTLPGQNPADSNVSLAAPHGTIDAGSAGIRVSGNLNIVALQVLNAYNVQVQGATAGVPVAPTANVASLTTAQTAAGAAAAAATPASSQNGSQSGADSVIIVQVLGYGGGDGGGDGGGPGEESSQPGGAQTH